MKIGIIGFGAIGFDVAKKIDQEKDQFNVIGVHSRTKNKIIEEVVSKEIKETILNEGEGKHTAYCVMCEGEYIEICQTKEEADE